MGFLGLNSGLSGTPVEWHVIEVASVIKNLRREGRSDAEITTLLRSSDGWRKNVTILGGPNSETIAYAFEYADTGKLNRKVECDCPGDSRPYFSVECCEVDDEDTEDGPGDSSFFTTGRVLVGLGLGAIAVVL